jgi:DNA topoisomerase-1
MSLIIVESPTKARTFNRLLKGKDFFVFATMGHIRDLPPNKISLDYNQSFKPDYKIIENKKKVVDQLKRLLEKNQEIILATDPDREGESIAYHAAFILGFIEEKWPEFEINPKGNLKRIVFHEITSHALEEALKNPSMIRTDLVKAQQARRILDRIVGYELSPLLWKKMGKNWLSAGRVQTVALRLMVEREKEIRNFKTEPYYQIYGLFLDGAEIKAKLIQKADHVYEQKYKLQLFDGEYQFTKTDISVNNVEGIKTDLQNNSFKIAEINETVSKRYPPPPHTTSLLQQDAFNRYGFSSKMTMKLAQDLYERGLITYHRTDSFNLSTSFVFRAKEYIEKAYGKEYALEKPRGFKTKSKTAQEAHEAIRPTKLNEDINAVKDKKITKNHRRLYQLIFARAVSTQMKEADIKQIKVKIKSSKEYLFESDFQQVLFDGFLKLLNREFVEKNLKPVVFKENEPLKLKALEAQESATKPPPRYNEASIIKSLEEKGIGRPSTYAPIISLIQSKNYIEKEFRYFIPTKLGEAISDYLSGAFPKIFDVNFTADMERGLDEIAGGEKAIVELLTEFYQPFKMNLEDKKNDTEVIDVEEEIKETCEKCGGKMVIRFSRYGKFMACSNYPNCKNTKPFLKFVPNKNCPKCQGRVVIKYTKSRKRFYGCENYPKCDYSSWKLG